NSGINCLFRYIFSALTLIAPRFSFLWRRFFMSCKQAIIFLLLLISGSNLVAKNKDKESPSGWLPITQQDFSVNKVPNDPGADAIQLYMSYYKDDDAKFISVYKRIRILRESGLKRADV